MVHSRRGCATIRLLRALVRLRAGLSQAPGALGGPRPGLCVRCGWRAAIAVRKGTSAPSAPSAPGSISSPRRSISSSSDMALVSSESFVCGGRAAHGAVVGGASVTVCPRWYPTLAPYTAGLRTPLPHRRAHLKALKPCSILVPLIIVLTGGLVPDGRRRSLQRRLGGGHVRQRHGERAVSHVGARRSRRAAHFSCERRYL